jgi:aryl-alcohol dehydrogenase-like predicted oxidoreductase
MDHRRIGGSDVTIAPLVLGGNVFGWTADRKTSFELLDAYIDAGFNAVDTADAYSRWVPGHVGGESETVIGEWLTARRRRAQVVLATKVGVVSPREGEPPAAEYSLYLSAAHIVQAV